MSAERYAAQVALLVRCLPEIAVEEAFALKGGTAINLFIHDLPRFSVDIDLVYLPVAERTASLDAIQTGFARIAEEVLGVWPRPPIDALERMEPATLPPGPGD